MAGFGEADPYAAAYGEGPYQVAYDGFGNPVGAFPALAALAPLAMKALPFVASALPGLLKTFLGNPQLGYAPARYASAGGLGYYGEPEAFDGYYAEPYIDPATGYSGYAEPAAPQQVVFDGYGNPVGAFPALAALAPLAMKALPFVASALPGLLKTFLGNPQLGYAPAHGYGGAGGFGCYGEPDMLDGFYAEPLVDPATGYSGYAQPAVPHQVVYDGFGNPVGAFPALAALAPLAAKVLPTLLPAVASALPGLLGTLFGRKKSKGGLGFATPGLGRYGEPDFDGYGYYAGPGYSLGYAPALGAAPAGYGGYGHVVYDGFGNPVGSIPALTSLASKFIPAITQAIPKVTGLIQRVLPQAQRVVRSLVPVARGLVSALPKPAVAPMLPPPMIPDGGDGPEPAPVAPVVPVAPVTPVVPVAPAPVPVPYPAPGRIPGSPQDIAYCRQLLRNKGGLGRRRRRRRRSRG